MRERSVLWVLRAAAYSIVIVTTFIFAIIFFRGAPVVFSLSPPFVNVEFLTQSPESLHVFVCDGKTREMGDTEFRTFKKQHPLATISSHRTFSYSAGGILPCIAGTVLLVAGSMLLSLVLGIFCAIYLSEYSHRGPYLETVRLAILNLAGVPSIVFGLFGFGLFVLAMPVIQDFPAENTISIGIGFGYFLNFTGWGVSLVSGCCTLAIMALPTIITASEEALRAVPRGFREGSLALGATKWQTIRTNVLPYAMPGILTSSILGITRVAGETAPIMFTAAYAILNTNPWEVERLSDFFFQGVMALPYHIYVVSSKIPQNEYTHDVQYGSCFVFLAVVLALALCSILLRIKLRKRLNW